MSRLVLPMLFVVSACSPSGPTEMLAPPQLWCGEVWREESIDFGSGPVARDPDPYITCWDVNSCPGKSYRTVRMQDDDKCFFRLDESGGVMVGGPCRLNDTLGNPERYRSTGGALTELDGGVFVVNWKFEKDIDNGAMNFDGTSTWTMKAMKHGGRPSVALDLCNTPDYFGK